MVEQQHPSDPPPLRIGPGARLAGLARWIRGRVPQDGVRVLADLAELLEPEGIGGGVPRRDRPIRGRLLLDVDALPREDLGLVLRFLSRAPGWVLLLTGDDAGAPLARHLLQRAGVAWCTWPLDVLQLDALLAPLPGVTPSTPPPRAAGATGAHVDELSAIEAILRDERELIREASLLDEALHATAPPPRSERGRRAPAVDEPLDEPVDAPAVREPSPAPELLPDEPELPDDDALLLEDDDDLDPLEETLADGGFEDGGFDEPLEDEEEEQDEASWSGTSAAAPLGLELSAEELAAFLEPLPVPAEPRALPAPPPARDLPPEALPSAPAAEQPLPPPPSWYRAQVADLADIAQGLDLSLRALRDGRDPSPVLERHAGDVSRVVQFARTLGYLAAPPGPGAQAIAVGTLLEEQLGGLAGATPQSPRYLFRSDSDLVVRSDKALLTAAFDALLQLATACSREGDVVRVDSRAEQEPAPGVRVRITFPAGPLTGHTPEEILAPYGLRRTLPQIGPNALAAASRLVEGQGGRVDLGEDEGGSGRLAFVVRLPRA